MTDTQEERNGFLVSAQMKQVWQIQLGLLKKLLEVCKKYNLKIWAEGGTLLGAIRHKGYIPWDDDIDMMMLREDYEKLVSIAPKEFTGNLFFQCAKTEKDYIRGHAQLRRSDTSAILPSDLWQSFNQGIFIDIFVFDYLPQTEKERKDCFRKLEKRRKILRGIFYGTLLSRNPFSLFISKLHIKKARDYKKYYDLMEKDIVNYPNKSNSIIGSVLWTSINYQKYMRNIEWYNETLYVPFEDIEIPIPFGYDAILHRQYGDYMRPVKAPTIHGEVTFDTKRPYIEVLKELQENASLKQKLQHFLSFRALKD